MLPFQPGEFAQVVEPLILPVNITLKELMESLDSRKTTVLPPGNDLEILPFTTVTPSSATSSIIDSPSKLSDDEIARMLATLTPANIKPSATKRARRADPDPPGTKYPYVTQFCANGGHQGQKVLSFRGSLMPSCRGTYEIWPHKVSCTCWCHALHGNVEAMILVPAIDMGADALAVGAAVTDGARAVESTPTEPEDIGFNPNEGPFDRLLNNVAMPLGPRVRNLVLTHLGREVTDEMKNELYVTRKRGELDSNVEAICRLWLARSIPWELLTTDVIALLVDVDNPPSAGAVHAVLSRWDNANLAIIEKNPMRFVCFTPTVQEIGIEAAMKLAHRRARASERGFKV
jgi:hypothetical protein